MEYRIKNINNCPTFEIEAFYNRLYLKKKNKIDKYKKSKELSIVGDMLLNELFTKYNLNYDKLEFDLNENGKPYLKNNKCYFNVSHSHDYVIAVVGDKEIGVDIEKVRKIPIGVIDKFATEKEKKYILSSNKNIEERIFKIYTLKEAYFKMKGSNLNNIFNVEFVIDNDNVFCSDLNVFAKFIDDIDGYVVAYCEKIS